MYFCQHSFTSLKLFQADKILQQCLGFVNIYDIESLRAYWNHLESRIFCQFELSQLNTVKKMEYNLYKYYLVNCAQNGKKKECLEFFEKFSQVILTFMPLCLALIC